MVITNVETQVTRRKPILCRYGSLARDPRRYGFLIEPIQSILYLESYDYLSVPMFVERISPIKMTMLRNYVINSQEVEPHGQNMGTFLKDMVENRAYGGIDVCALFVFLPHGTIAVLFVTCTLQRRNTR